MKIITATLASLALAAGLAAPTTASANNEDFAKIVAGIATAAIIAKIAEDRRDRRREAAQTTQSANSTWHRDRTTNDRGRVFGTITRGGQIGVQSRQQHKTVQLPARCERTVYTPRGKRLVYVAPCLNRNYRHASRLPDRCRVLIETPRGNRPAYTAQCLRRDGWNVARR